MTTTPSIEWFDKHFLETAARIEQHGYTNICVDYGVCSCPGCDSPPGQYPWSYTLGFDRLDHPELVMGLPMRHVNCVSRAVFVAALDGVPFEVGPSYRHHLHEGLTVSLMPVPDRWLERDPSRIAQWFSHFGYQRAPRLLQAVWADASGMMPWEYDIRPAAFNQQPVLVEDPIRFPTPPRNNRQVGRTAKRRRR